MPPARRIRALALTVLLLASLPIIAANMRVCLAQQERQAPSQGDIDEAVAWAENPSNGGSIVVKTEKLTNPASETYRYQLVVYSYREKYTSYTPETPEGVGMGSFEATIYEQKGDGRLRPATTVFQEGVISSVPLTYVSLDDVDKELALAEAAVRDYVQEWGLLPGWVPPENTSGIDEDDEMEGDGESYDTETDDAEDEEGPQAGLQLSIAGQWEYRVKPAYTEEVETRSYSWIFIGASVSGSHFRSRDNNANISFEGTMFDDRISVNIRFSGGNQDVYTAWEAKGIEVDIPEGGGRSFSDWVRIEVSHQDVDLQEYGNFEGRVRIEVDFSHDAAPPQTMPPGTEGKQVEGEQEYPGGISDIGDIPGPENWPQAATGILLPGLLGLFISLLGNLFKGGGTPTAVYPGGPVAPSETPPAAPPLDDLTLHARKWIANQRKYSQYRTDPAYRELIDNMEKDCFGPDGRVHWGLYCEYEFGPVRDMKRAYRAKEDMLLLHAKEFAGATRDSVVDTAVAAKDGVVGFAQGISAIPGTIYQGYRELGGLLVEGVRDAAKDFWNPVPLQRRSGLLNDLTNPEVLRQTGVNLYQTAGKELLPIDEVTCFFESDAALEERLWAVPSAALKITNVIMMSPKLPTMPVRGIPGDLTPIKHAKPANQAVEAGRASVPAEVQAEYDAYRAAAARKASEITTTVEGGGRLTREQVLEAMSDPATMRQLKDAPTAVQRKLHYTQAREVYSPVYRDVIAFMEEKYPDVEFRMKALRTPRQKSLINTDNDVVLLRKTTGPNGETYWEEVPAEEWSGKYHDSFSQRTGFDPEKARARFPEENWDTMTPRQQRKAWAEKHGQETMDVTQPEAARAFSDQPTAMRPDWKPGARSPVAEGKLVDAEGLGFMERYKTARGWQEATVREQSELMEQGAKAGALSKRLAAQSQARTGYRYGYPKAFEQGLEIINRRELAPAVRDAALKNLGFRGGYVEFMDKLSSWMGGLR
jgi:hypothetical protein